jgi:mycofactocin system FadH/OYE family oxidoreductase 2
MSRAYRYLFQNIQIGPVRLNNRIVFTAHLTNLSENGLPGERLAYYYRERARGGAGLIITEEQSVHPTDRAYEKLIEAYREDVIPGYRLITGMVHQYGTKIFAQLNHNGNQGSSIYTGLPLWAPSPVRDPLFREVPKEMDRFDIARLVAGYALAAVHVREGGFDGLELQASHSSILRQFLSPLTNHRRDQYGGSLDNRLRLVLEVAAAVRNVVGEQLALGIRLSGDEFTDGGLTLEDTVEIARRLDQAGLFDYINTSVGIATRNLYLVEGSMAMPPGYSVYMSSAIRKAVKIPVVAVGRIKDPVQAEQILREGHADLIGMVRAQIADPWLANKALQGMNDSIRTCLSCNQDCIGRVGLNKTIGCVQNPAVGQEKTRGEGCLQPAPKSRLVLVAGGGPAGLAAAKTAALRGHRVILWEKEDVCGGQVRLAARLPYREEFLDLIRNLRHCLEEAGVELRLGCAASPEKILAEKPDAVIVATGSLPQHPPALAGGENLYTARQVLEEEPELGQNVLVVDLQGFYQAAGVAELLAGRGKRVEIASPNLYVGQGLGPTLDLEMWYRRAHQLGITMTPDVTVLAVEGSTVRGVHNYSGREVEWRGVDSVVTAAPNRVNDELYFALKGKVAALYRIGDCLAPRRVDAAILEGYRVAAGL